MNQPLAEQLRPDNLSHFFGQTHLLKKTSLLRQAIDNKQLHSMIFYGPPGTGKTTLAKIIAEQTEYHFEQLSAVTGGIKEVRGVLENAKKFQNIDKQTLLFVDEIHRFNKTQQDGFLPHIESGLLILIGATTENPSFALNRALLSRLSVYVFQPLNPAELQQILTRVLQHKALNLTDKALKQRIISASSGDARRLISIVEQIALADLNTLNSKTIETLLPDKLAVFDKGGEVFYQQLSAFHKSVRGSSADGALYWFARMVSAGCDAKIIARRLLAIASEDIGNADPKALEITLNAWDIYHRVGEKEGHRAIAQAAVYCAVAAKSNAVYLAFKQALTDAQASADMPVPNHLCNAPDELSQQLGKSQGYRYAHNEADAYACGQTYFPDKLGEQTYYQPNERGLEIKIKQKLQQLKHKKSSTGEKK